MQQYKLLRFKLVLGFAAMLAGIAAFGLTTFGLTGTAQAGALTVQGTSGANKAISQLGDAGVVQVAKKRSKRLRRGNRLRRHGKIRRHTRIHRHRAHRRYGRKRHRRSSLIFSYSHPYPYGYGSPYYGYGYGYPYYSYADPYYPPAVYVAPRHKRRASYRRSCRSLGVGTRRWVRCCSRKYRSFNRHTGKYLSHSGRYRACR